jgi:hypothetical protein
MDHLDNIAIWKNKFKEKEASGLSVNAWCKKNNISKYTYYNWYKKVSSSQQELATKLFVEIPTTVSSGSQDKVDPVVSISWKGFSFQLNDKESIPLLTALMKELVDEC